MNRGMKVLQTFALPLGYVTMADVFATSEWYYNIGTGPLSRENCVSAQNLFYLVCTLIYSARSLEYMMV